MGHTGAAVGRTGSSPVTPEARALSPSPHLCPLRPISTSPGPRSAPFRSGRGASPLGQMPSAPRGAPCASPGSQHIPQQPRGGSPASAPRSQLRKLRLRAVTALARGPHYRGTAGFARRAHNLAACPPSRLFSLASFWDSPSYLPAHLLLPENNHYICLFFPPNKLSSTRSSCQKSR